MHNDSPTLASLLRKECQVTHFQNSRGWLEAPDGRFFKPNPMRIQFIKGLNKPLIYTRTIKKGFISFLSKIF